MVVLSRRGWSSLGPNNAAIHGPPLPWMVPHLAWYSASGGEGGQLNLAVWRLGKRPSNLSAIYVYKWGRGGTIHSAVVQCHKWSGRGGGGGEGGQLNLAVWRLGKRPSNFQIFQIFTFSNLSAIYDDSDDDSDSKHMALTRKLTM